MKQAFKLAAHGHNNKIGPSGYSPFQWTRGAAPPQEDLPAEIAPRQAFGGPPHLREKALIAFEQEHAKYKLSRLNNANWAGADIIQSIDHALEAEDAARQDDWSLDRTCSCTTSRRINSAVGIWSNPFGQRPTSPKDGREELGAALDGVAIYWQPVKMETLLRSFTGRRYTNVTGENPSRRTMVNGHH